MQENSAESKAEHLRTDELPAIEALTTEEVRAAAVDFQDLPKDQKKLTEALMRAVEKQKGNEEFERKLSLTQGGPPTLTSLVYQLKTALMTEPHSFESFDLLRAVLAGISKLETKIETLEKELTVIGLRAMIDTQDYYMVPFFRRPPQNVNDRPTESFKDFRRLPKDIRERIWAFYIEELIRVPSL